MDYETLNSPWAITPEALRDIASRDFMKLDDSLKDVRASQDEEERCETFVEWKQRFLAQFEEKLTVTDDGVASINISGPLMPNPGLVDRYYFNAADSVRIANLIQAAANSEEIRTLVMSISSPGGMVIGTPEMGDAVRAFNEKGGTSYAFADTLMASAAYWVGSQATHVVTTKSALIGSIGVIRPHVDASGYHDKLGLKVEIFRGGSLKVAGAMNTSLTDEQREHIQDGVDAAHEDFKAAVNHRRTIADEHMQGQVFYGKDAVKVGVADGNVDNLKKVIVAAHSDKEVDMVGETIMSNPADIKTEAPEGTEDNPTAEERIADVSGQLDTANGRIAELEASESDLQSSVDSLTEERDSANARAESLNTEKADADSKLDDLQKAHDELKEDFDAKVEAAAKAKAEELAPGIAAKLASDAGVDPADVSNADGNDDGEQYANESEAWERYAQVRKDDGDDAARAFYVKHIEGKF